MELNNDLFMRQLKLAPPSLMNKPLVVIGAGAIGSHATLALAKMGCRDITVYDPDTVELHNLPNQLFLYEASLGRHKVDVLQETIKQLTGIEISIVPELFTQDGLKEVVISGVDSMRARKEIWEWVKYSPVTELYIDGRMGGLVGILHHVETSNRTLCESYETTLFDDKDSSELPCTERSICFTQFGLASMIASTVRQYLVEGQISIPKSMVFDFQNGYVGKVESFHLCT